MNNQKKMEIKFRLKTIKVEGFSFSELEDSKFDINTTIFEFNSGIRVIPEEETILILLGIALFNDPDKKIQLCNLKVSYEFHVIGLRHFPRKDNTIKIPDDILIQFFALAISTSRGILFDKCAGTYLSEIILPLINPATLLPKKQQELKKTEQIV